MDDKFNLIMCIVNKGFSDLVMDVARENGATGGTVISARGTAREEIFSKFEINFEPEKEVALIIVPLIIKDNILRALYERVGLHTPSHGMTISLPIDDVVGLKKKENE